MRLNSWLTSLYRHMKIARLGTARRRRVSRSISAPVALECLEQRQMLSAAAIAPQVIMPLEGAVPAGVETQINSHAAGNQSHAQIARDAAGDYVVVWQSFGQDGSGYGVFAQRFNAAGVAQGTEFRVNTYVTGNQSNPSVAMDAVGDFVVAWQGEGQYFGQTRIYAQRYNAAGVAQGVEFDVSKPLTTAPATSTAPSVAMDAEGDFVIAFQNVAAPDSAVSGNTIFARRYSAGGSVLGNEFQVSQPSTRPTGNASATMDATGDFVIAWENYEDGTYTRVFAQRFDPLGNSEGPEIQPFSPATGAQGAPSVAMDAVGDFVLTWSAGPALGLPNQIIAQRFDTTGAFQGGPIQVNTNTTDGPMSPSVAMDAQGEFVVTWTGQGATLGSNNVFARVFSPAGNPESNEFQVNTNTSNTRSHAHMAIDAAGDFTVTWQSYAQDGDAYGIFSQRFQASVVVPSGPETRVNTYTPSQQTQPQIAMDAAGDYVVVWTGVGDGEGTGIFGQRYNAAGVAVGGQFQINTYTTGYESQPSVAMDAAGDFVVTWTRYTDFFATNSFASIHGQRYNAAGVAQGGEFQVDTFTQTVADVTSSVAMDAAGDFVVAWTREHEAGPPVLVDAQRFNATGVALGQEFQVSQSTGFQTTPSVAMDAAGDFVVAWNNTDAFIDAQRFNSAGIAQGAIFHVGGVDPALPRVAMDAAGDFVVTWFGYQGPASGFDVYAQSYNAAGTAQGAQFVVNTHTNQFQESPSIAMDASGDYVITWQSYAQDGSSWGIFAQRFSSGGNEVGSEFQVNTYAHNIQTAPAVAIDTAGDFVVAWQSYFQDGNGYGIYAQRYTTSPTVTAVLAGAGPQIVTPGDELTSSINSLSVLFSEYLNTVPGGANSVTNPANWQLTRYGVDVSNLITGITFQLNPITNQYAAVLTFSQPLTQGGYQLVARHAIQDLYGRALNNGTDFTRNFWVADVVAAGNPTQAITNNHFDQMPSVATDAAGDYIVVSSATSTNGPNLGVHAQLFNKNGVAQGTEFLVTSDTSAAMAQVAMDAAGDFVITWASSSGVFAQRYNSVAVAQGGPITVNGTSGPFADPRIAMDAVGDFIVTWQHGDSIFDGVDVFARRFDAAGNAMGAQVEVTPIGSGYAATGYQDVAMNATGNYVITWESGGAIYEERFNSAGVAQGIALFVSNGTAPSVAIDAVGDFVVTWFDPIIPSNANVMAQRFRSDGVELGSEFQVNPASVPAFNYGTPAIAMDDVGDFAISWSVWSHGLIEIDTQRFSPAGIAQAGPLQASATVNPQLFPSVAIDPNGDLVVGWASFDNFGYDIYTQRYQADVAPLLQNIETTPVADVGSSPIVITNSLSIFDFDNTTASSATIQITGNYQNGQDQLLFTKMGNITGSWDATTGTMTLSGVGSLADYQAALRSVEFQTTGANTMSRTISFQLSDGLMGSNVVSRTVDIHPVVVSLVPATAGPATGSTVKFNLTFNEPVTGVTPGAFVLAESGVKGGVIHVSGSGTSYVVTVSGLSGSGTIGLNLTNFASIVNASNEALLSGFIGSVQTLLQTGGPVQLTGHSLTVKGISGNDIIVISEVATLQIVVNGATFDFDPATINAISVLPSTGNDMTVVDSLKFGTAFSDVCGNGNDTVIINAAVTTPTTLKAGSGNDILIGGSGNDTLIGGSGRNLLIGGAGTDKIVGNGGDDILIGGTTTFDSNVTALNAIMKEWTSAKSYATRVAHLRGTQGGGLNGGVFLTSSTVTLGTTKETLTGRAGHDWFWATSLDITDRTLNEFLN